MSDKITTKGMERRRFIRSSMQMALAVSLGGVAGYSLLKSTSKKMVWQIVALAHCHILLVGGLSFGGLSFVRLSEAS